jgi:hypothetical protein
MKPTSIAMGTVFLTTFFVLLPAAAIQVIQAHDWPRWIPL